MSAFELRAEGIEDSLRELLDGIAANDTRWALIVRDLDRVVASLRSIQFSIRRLEDDDTREGHRGGQGGGGKSRCHHRHH